VNTTKSRASAQTRATKRILNTRELIQLSDWLRTPGHLEGLGTYQDVLDKVNELKVLDKPASLSSISHTMVSLGYKLTRTRKPRATPANGNSDAVLRKLTEVVAQLCAYALLDTDTPNKDRLKAELAELHKLLEVL